MVYEMYKYKYLLVYISREKIGNISKIWNFYCDIFNYLYGKKLSIKL